MLNLELLSKLINYGANIDGPINNGQITFHRTSNDGIEVHNQKRKAFTIKDRGNKGGTVRHNMLDNEDLDPGSSTSVTTGIFTGTVTANDRPGITYNDEPIELS